MLDDLICYIKKLNSNKQSVYTGSIILKNLNNKTSFVNIEDASIDKVLEELNILKEENMNTILACAMEELVDDKVINMIFYTNNGIDSIKNCSNIISFTDYTNNRNIKP